MLKAVSYNILNLQQEQQQICVKCLEMLKPVSSVLASTCSGLWLSLQTCFLAFWVLVSSI